MYVVAKRSGPQSFSSDVLICVYHTSSINKEIKFCPQIYVLHTYEHYCDLRGSNSTNDFLNSLFFNATCLQRLIKQTMSINLTGQSRIIISFCCLPSSIIFTYFSVLHAFFSPYFLERAIIV